MAGKRIRVRDKRLRRFIRTLRSLGGITVTVGVQGEEATKDHPESEGVPMVVIAAAHELGLGNVPKRSFLRASYDMNRDRYVSQVVRGSRQAAKGMRTAYNIMWEAGESIRADVIERVRSGIPPPLKPATVRKTGSIPLIDKGHLMGSITSVVHRGG